MLITRKYALSLRAVGKATFRTYVRERDGTYFISLDRHDLNRIDYFKTDNYLRDSTMCELDPELC